VRRRCKCSCQRGQSSC